MKSTRKDPRLVAVVDRLRQDLGSGYFVLVDHWDGDELAVGLARVDAPGVLVYLAVLRDSDDMFVECEVPAGAFYEVAARQEHAGYADVLRAVAGHLHPVDRPEFGDPTTE